MKSTATNSRITPHPSRLRFPRFGVFWALSFGIWNFAHSATVTGDLKDISVQALNTKIMFSPTTNVLLTASGLSAGPPRIIDTVSGSFTLDLEAGDYTVSLPLLTS